MDESWRLLSLSCAMFVGSFVAGAVPLAVSFSEKSLRFVSIVGAGLLVGTALAVIIPEGVHTLYEQQENMLIHKEHEHHLHTRDQSSHAPSTILDGITAAKGAHSHEHEHSGHGLELHTLIGVSLCLGFIFMLVIDQIAGGHSHGSPDSDNKRSGNRSITATIGLVIHSAADGIALGAAARTSRTDVEMIIFFAIMLHKAPAAFGLTTFLLHESYERNRIRKHLLIFSLAAPFGAIATFYGLSQGSKEVLSSFNGTGIAMLFSAGTFLYVATVHILPDISHAVAKPSLEEGPSNNIDHSHDKFSRCDLCSLVGGILAPLFFASFHQH